MSSARTKWCQYWFWRWCIASIWRIYSTRRKTENEIEWIRILQSSTSHCWNVFQCIFTPCMSRARPRQTNESVCIEVCVFFLFLLLGTEIKFMSKGMITPHVPLHEKILYFQPIFRSQHAVLKYGNGEAIYVAATIHTMCTPCVEHTRHRARTHQWKVKQSEYKFLVYSNVENLSRRAILIKLLLFGMSFRIFFFLQRPKEKSRKKMVFALNILLRSSTYKMEARSSCGGSVVRNSVTIVGSSLEHIKYCAFASSSSEFIFSLIMP